LSIALAIVDCTGDCRLHWRLSIALGDCRLSIALAIVDRIGDCASAQSTGNHQSKSLIINPIVNGQSSIQSSIQSSMVNRQFNRQWSIVNSIVNPHSSMQSSVCSRQSSVLVIAPRPPRRVAAGRPISA
jgi:hypothetical protein